MNLKPISEIPEASKVILRMDLDVPIENGVILDSNRLQKSIVSIEYLLANRCKVIIIGHRGRPKGVDLNFSLKIVYAELMALLDKGMPISSVFIDDVLLTEKIKSAIDLNDLVFIENIRFWAGEEENDDNFRKYLASLGEVYVNDAFAVAHRGQASIMLFKELRAYYGISFIEEAEKISKVLENPERPLVVILGGAKEDKLQYLDGLEKMADQVLVGGKLPKLISNDTVPAGRQEFQMSNENKCIVAKLKTDGLDLSDDDITTFKKYITMAKTIVWAGAMGYYEKEENRKGTEEIAKAVALAGAYKIIAGGDTRASIVKLGLKDKIDFICSGGGVMLEFLTKGKLAAWE